LAAQSSASPAPGASSKLLGEDRLAGCRLLTQPQKLPESEPASWQSRSPRAAVNPQQPTLAHARQTGKKTI